MQTLRTLRSEIIVVVAHRAQGKVSVQVHVYGAHVLAVLAANSKSVRIKIKITHVPFTVLPTER